MQAFIEAVLNVLTIVALISATAFIIIFLVDLFMSISNKNGSIFFRNRREADDVVRPKIDKETATTEAVAQPVMQEENIRPQVLQQPDAEIIPEAEPAQSWDEEAVRREQQAMAERAQNDQLMLLDEPFEQKEQKQQQFVSDFDDFDSLFDDISTESKGENDELAGEAEPVIDFDAMIDEINQECVTRYEASKDVEIVEPVQELLESAATPEGEDFGVKETAEERVESIIEAKNEEAEATAEAVEAKIVNVYEFFPLDALNDRLTKLKERLKINERDLKANRKEYTPLARVNRSLKRDQEKLRRKEAVVARKKVLLYGVNNYVDIDEDKAKKLSEDLDLLDGLRLSVQHCEEVMEQNKDRFPILESTNRILVDQNKQIKEDIAEVKAAIEKLNNENNDATESNGE